MDIEKRVGGSEPSRSLLNRILKEGGGPVKGKFVARDGPLFKADGLCYNRSIVEQEAIR